MDDNNNGEFNYSASNDFKQVPKKEKKSCGKGVSILGAFFAGMVGALVVLVVIFAVPGFREEIIGDLSDLIVTDSNSETSNNSSYDATLMDIAEYSETSVAVAEEVLPSVVGITVTYNISSFGSSGTAEATGSGVIISEDGYIITNNHVINSESSSVYYQVTEATNILVHLYGDSDDIQYEATVVGSDSSSDLAVLKIETDEDLQAITIGDSDNLRVGEFVMAVGNPLGLDSSVTCGVISALDREVTDSDGTTYICIQTDAAINSGNSGGALVNSEGQVIGINTLKVSSTGVEGIGFAIPINSTTDVIDELITYNKVRRPYIGISGRDVDAETASQYGLVEGIYVVSVEEYSPAETAGIQAGDVIIAINGTEVTTIDELNEIKNTYEIGDTVTLTIVRDGSEQEVSVTLGESE